MALLFNRRTPVTPRWALQLFWLFTRKPVFRPIWNPKLVSSDLLGQAKFLAHAGYFIASGMLARSFVERSIKRLAMISPNWKIHRPTTSVRTIAESLFDSDIIDEKALAAVIRIYSETSKICHDGKVSRAFLRHILADCNALKRHLERATQIALSKVE